MIADVVEACLVEELERLRDRVDERERLATPSCGSARGRSGRRAPRGLGRPPGGRRSRSACASASAELTDRARETQHRRGPEVGEEPDRRADRLDPLVGVVGAFHDRGSAGSSARAVRSSSPPARPPHRVSVGHPVAGQLELPQADALESGGPRRRAGRRRRRRSPSRSGSARASSPHDRHLPRSRRCIAGLVSFFVTR